MSQYYSPPLIIFSLGRAENGLGSAGKMEQQTQENENNEKIKTKTNNQTNSSSDR